MSHKRNNSSMAHHQLQRPSQNMSSVTGSYGNYRDQPGVTRRSDSNSIYRDGRQNNERSSQYYHQQDYSRMSGSPLARKNLPFRSSSRLDFEEEFGLHGGHDGSDYQDDRIQNILLDEICSDFGIKDAIDLDIFDLDAVYPTTRLSDDLEDLDQTIPFAKIEAEAEQARTMMPPPVTPRNIGRNPSMISGGVNKGYPQKSGNSSISQVGWNEIIEAVASPTISSSCEGGTTSAAMTGSGAAVKSQPPDSTSGGDCSGGSSSVHSTTVTGGSADEDTGRGGGSGPTINLERESSHSSGEYKKGNIDVRSDSSKIRDSGKEFVEYGSHIKQEANVNAGRITKTPTTGPGRNVGPPPPGVPNFYVASSSRAAGSVQSSAYQNQVQSRSDAKVTTVVEDGSLPASASESCATSASTSPSQIHVAKKQRTINSGSELLEEVRECFAYVHGADLWAPTTHPTFNNPTGTPTSALTRPQQYVEQKNPGNNVGAVGYGSAISQQQRPGYPMNGSEYQGGYGGGGSQYGGQMATPRFSGDGMQSDAMRGIVRGAVGRNGPPMNFNNTPGPSCGGYQSCPDLTSPERKALPFSPGPVGSPLSSRAYSPAPRMLQNFGGEGVPVMQQLRMSTIDNVRSQSFATRPEGNYGSRPQSPRPDGGYSYSMGMGQSPRPEGYSINAMPHSPANSSRMYQQTLSAPCTPSKHGWDSTYHQGAMQASMYRNSPMSAAGGRQLVMDNGNPMVGGPNNGQPIISEGQSVIGGNSSSMNNNQQNMRMVGPGGGIDNNGFPSHGYGQPLQQGGNYGQRYIPNYPPNGPNNGKYNAGRCFAPNMHGMNDMHVGYRDNVMPSTDIPQPSSGYCGLPSRSQQSSAAPSAAVSPSQALPLSQHSFLRRLISEDSGAFRTHPLFPLLRDLIIADMNFHTPSFPFRLIANLPDDFDRLLYNYRARNPGLVIDHPDVTVQMVVMDAVKYAHSALIGKIRSRKRTEGFVDKVPAQNMDDFCETFERSVTRTPTNDFQSLPASTVCSPTRLPSSSGPDHTPSHINPYSPSPYLGGMRCGSGPPPMSSDFVMPYPIDCGGSTRLPMGRDLVDPTSLDDISVPYRYDFVPQSHLYYDDGRLIQSLPSSPRKMQYRPLGCDMGEKAGKNKVLPKEAVNVMIDWLREHQENPYPNDDEKESLIESTKLTINQINYWFTNARRRILPKWALQRHLAEQEKARQNKKSTAELIEARDRHQQRGSPSTVGGD